MDVEALKKILKDEGFLHIYEWEDGPNVSYAPHAHKDRVAMYILKGGLTFHFADKDVTLTEGGRFDVPKGEEHSAQVGTEGCQFLVGEMIEGDS